MSTLKVGQLVKLSERAESYLPPTNDYPRDIVGQVVDHDPNSHYPYVVSWPLGNSAFKEVELVVVSLEVSLEDFL